MNLQLDVLGPISTLQLSPSSSTAPPHLVRLETVDGLIASYREPLSPLHASRCLVGRSETAFHPRQVEETNN